MSRFADLTIAQFLDAVSSPTPTPGGGTVAATAGAMGAALLQMVARLPRTRTNSEDERAALAVVSVDLLSLRTELLTLADLDSDAYDEVMRAFTLAKNSEAEKAVRKAAIQQALRAATLVPLKTMQAMVSVLDVARQVAAAGNPAAASDIGVAVELIEAAFNGAAMNVRANLGGVDDDFRQKIQPDLDEAMARFSAARVSKEAAF